MTNKTIYLLIFTLLLILLLSPIAAMACGGYEPFELMQISAEAL